MKLQDFQKLGYFVDGSPEKHKVKIGEREIEIGVERISWAEAAKMHNDENLIFPAALIGRCVVFDDGEKLGYKQACQLDSVAFNALVDVVTGVLNGNPKA